MEQAIIVLAAAALAGCATGGTQAAGEATEQQPAGAAFPPGAMICNADRVEAYVGRQADQEAGAAILKDSGARRLRWGPPRAAWTMDYRQDRVNVEYDEAMKIIRITCG